MTIHIPHDTSTPLPDISVVIPTYNRIAMLKEALSSIYAQDYEGVVEVIVVDDNSQDSTPQIIQQRYPDIRLIALSKNVGPSAARNKGILIAKGEFIAFLDSDDLWEPNHLKSQMVLLRNVQDINAKYFCISDIFIWEMTSNKRYKKSQKPKARYSSALHHLLSGGSFVSTPSAVIFPQCILNEIGFFDETLRLGEDTDLYTRAVVAGYLPSFTEIASVTRRKHENDQAMTTKNIGYRIQNRLRAAKKYYPSAKQQLSGVTLQSIYAEIHTNFASHYYRDRYYIDWIKLSLTSARYSSLKLVISNMKSDVVDSTKDFFRSIRKTSAF